MKKKKTFASFQEFFKDLKFNFSANCHSETWSESIDAKKNSNYKLDGYRSFHQIRNKPKGGGLCIALRTSDAIEVYVLIFETNTHFEFKLQAFTSWQNVI